MNNTSAILSITDNSFKWYDESEMNFTKWTEEIDEVLMNTCAFMNTKSGKWEKKSCEEFPLTGTLCKTACKYNMALHHTGIILLVLLHYLFIRCSGAARLDFMIC